MSSKVTIWKFPLKVQSEVQTLSVPQDSVLLRVGNQRESLVAWIEVPESSIEKEERWTISIKTCLTGETWDKGDIDWIFIDTVQFDGGNFIAHVFVDPDIEEAMSS